MESTGTDGSSQPLAEFLERSREEILSAWEQALRGAARRALRRTATGARRARRTQVRDHVPELLDRLAQVIRAVQSGKPIALGDLPDLHARDRLGAGFDVETVARELALLRLVVFRRWQGVIGGQAALVVLEEVCRFDAALDEVVVRSIAARERVVAREREIAQAAIEHRERELERFFAISPDFLAVVGADGSLKRVNPAFQVVLGYSEEELIARPYLDLLHPDDREPARAQVAKVLAGEPAVRVTSRLLQKDGQVRWVTFNASAAPDAKTFAVVGRDVTDERHRAELEQQLIGIVSHDLRNPLSAIITTVAALLTRHAELDPRTLRSVSRIQSAADRAMTLIRDLLDFTKARTAGGIAVSPEPMDLHEHARAAAAEVHNAFPDREIRYEQSGAGEGSWDPGRIGQVVANLVSNAFKYGAPDAPVVVGTHGGDRWIRIEVHNEGRPIDPDLLPHIFEPLRQGRPAGGVGGAAGVGLGLYIVDHVVRAHGGSVDVVSTAAEGTTFVVRLPREPPSI